MKSKKKKSDHLNLLYDIGDLTDLLISSLSVDDFLQRAVEMVARYLDADVCSIYLYDEPSGELYLAATTGLNPDAVNRVRMKVGEGIVGHCFLTLKPVCEGKAASSPHFKFFEEAHEERFKSFLVVPIHRGAVKIGTIVVQHERADVFEEAEILALRAAASQLASSIENARLLMQMNPDAVPAPPRRRSCPQTPSRRAWPARATPTPRSPCTGATAPSRWPGCPPRKTPPPSRTSAGPSTPRPSSSKPSRACFRSACPKARPSSSPPTS